ncbi:MAG: hypothetical protein U0931_24870 [Vulcanimicrobiota bacterium]
MKTDSNQPMSQLKAAIGLLAPGHHGEKARIRCAYQLRKRLGMHQALEAQCQSQDLISQTERLGQAADRTLDIGLKSARQYCEDEARTARGLRRAMVGFGQGVTSVAETAVGGTRSLARLGLGAMDLSYRTLTGETSLASLASQGRRAAEVLGRRGAEYVVSGQLVTDCKKFSKSLGDYAWRVEADPVLEIPKAAAVLSAAVLAVGPRRLVQAAEGISGLSANLARIRVAASASADSVACAAEVSPAAVARPASQLLPPVTSGTPGGIVPRGFARAGAPAPVCPPTAAVAPAVNQELVSNLKQALKLSEQAASDVPTPPAPVELPPNLTPLPQRTPHCLPASNYQPVAPRGYLRLLDTLESSLNIVG